MVCILAGACHHGYGASLKQRYPLPSQQQELRNNLATKYGSYESALYAFIKANANEYVEILLEGDLTLFIDVFQKFIIIDKKAGQKRSETLFDLAVRVGNTQATALLRAYLNKDKKSEDESKNQGVKYVQGLGWKPKDCEDSRDERG